MVWTAIVFAIYFGYGIRNSTLRFKVNIQEGTGPDVLPDEAYEKRKLISSDAALAEADCQDEGKYRHYAAGEERDEPFTINGGRRD